LVWSLPESRRFGSSGLNLTSKGLLLGTSLRIPAEGTNCNPCQLDFQIPNALNHVGEKTVIMFCRKTKVSRAFRQRLRWIDGAPVGIVAWAEARSRRWHVNHQSEVARGPRAQATCGSISLVC
jgi:hypothetical protein